LGITEDFSQAKRAHHPTMTEDGSEHHHWNNSAVVMTELNTTAVVVALVVSAKEVMFSSLFVCLLATLRKNF